MKDINVYRLVAYVGEEHRGSGYTEMEFNPHEYAVIFRDSNDTEIWLDPDSIDKMADELKEYATKLKPFLLKENPESCGDRNKHYCHLENCKNDIDYTSPHSPQ